MTNIKIGVTDVQKLAKALDAGEFSSAEDMALAALEIAYQMYEDKAQFVIVGQLHYAGRSGYAKSNGDRVALGPYSTLGDAKAAGTSLSLSAATKEEFRWWMLPYHHGTPATWFKARKMARYDEEAPLTSAERIIVRYNKDKAHLWGLTPDGKRIVNGEEFSVDEAA